MTAPRPTSSFKPSASSLLALALFLAPGCTPSTDLGQTCKMTKPPPTEGGEPVEIDESEVGNTSVDYVALGSAECDDLVCIRTASSNNPPNDAGKARGYCTAPCIDETNCEYDYLGGRNKLTCARLLLSEEFIKALQQEDPETFERVFGSSASAKYCILPRQVQ